MKEKRVLVVFCIDTEGPFTDPNYYLPSQLLGSWKEIDKTFLSKIFSKELRFNYPDSLGRPVLMSWFILNWVGFRTNPIKHDLGYHKVFDHYTKVWGKEIKKYGDEIAWHYHHPSLSGIGNEWGTDWLINREYENVLCRTLIDRNFFPTAYRAGGTIEDNDQSHWLERWVPIDYSNRNGPGVNWEKKEADGKTLKELLLWNKAPIDWEGYHPSYEDLTKRGKMGRTIVRTVDIKSSVHTLSLEEVETAFQKAKEGKNVILSLFEHDFRDRSETILQAIRLISDVSNKYKTGFYYSTATDAVKLVQRKQKEKTFKLEIKTTLKKITISSKKRLYSQQPFLAIKHSKNLYRWAPLYKTGENTWEYHLLPEDEGKYFGVAAHSERGYNLFTKVLKLKR